MNSRVFALLAAFWMCGAGVPPVCAQTEKNSAERLLKSFDFSSHPSSRHYTMNDGLPETGVNWVIQDSRGFIWLATDAGLSKFDGHNFTTYKPNPGSANSLGNKVVNTLWEDHFGKLWVGHDSGLDLFDPRTEEFRSLDPDTLDSHNGVRKFRPRTDGKLWICGFGGIYIADIETLSMQRMPGLPHDAYWDIAEARDRSIWAAGESGLIHIEGKTGEASVYRHDPNDPTSLAGNICLSIFIDEQERVWIGGQGLNLFDAKSKSFTHLLTDNQVRYVMGDSDGKLLIGHGRGLYSFDPQTGTYELMSDGWSTSILKDRQGIIWHSSLWGLNQINPKNRKLRMAFRTNEQFGYCIRSIVTDANNDIWMLTYVHGAYRYDPSFSKVLQHIQKQYARISADSEGSIWLISSGKLEKYDFRSRTISAESMPVRDKEHIISTFVDSFGNVWLGESNTVGKYNRHNKIREQLASLPTGPYCFLEDSNKNLWIGSGKGLVRYNLINAKLDVFENDPYDEQSLSDNLVFNVMMDAEENIWIGTGDGLNKMIKGSGNGKPRFARWQSGTSGLPHDNVTGIVDGADGTLWLTSGNVISHFDPKKNHFRNYDHKDGLGGLGGTSFTRLQFARGLRTSDGKITFGTYCKGLVIFHPDSLEDNAYVPPVVITNLFIDNMPVPVGASAADTLEWESPLDKGISYTNEVALTYQQNDFAFEFAALNFIDTEGNQYKYRLEPYENEWISTTAGNRIARYTNIDPGKYTFRVVGSNNDGIWNEKGASLQIIITPPWWQTWWAYALYGLTFIAFVLYWRSYENQRIKLKHRAEHLSELDSMKTRFFTNISHEFRTPITLILGPLKELFSGTFKGDQKSAFGSMIRNGQRLLHLINQLLDLSKLEEGKMHLYPIHTDLVEFIREIAASYESLAKGKGIKYFFYPETQQINAYIDQEKIEKVVNNLLSNSFKFTKVGGEVILYLKTEKGGVTIAVKDTGIGISSDQIEKVFDRFFQVDSSQTRGYDGTGLGMAIAKELVDLHHGKIIVESAEGKGTTFTVWLPLGREHLKEDEISESGESERARSLMREVILRDGDISLVEPVDNPSVTSEQHPVILIVEDNRDMRQYIRRTLTEFYDLVEACDGMEGVKRAQEIIPDLIISDIMMPEMDGYQFCEIIKSNELTSHVPVILLTAKADQESKLKGLETGADDYLFKPFDSDELKLIVRNLIDLRRKLRERFGKEITLEPRRISITSLDEKFLTKVLSIIEVRLEDENFSIDELSHEACYSNVHFYRKIKALTAQTPSQFLRTIRLKRAAYMLSRNSDNVTQIAYSVGFSSVSYFNKCFKEQFGVTPGQYLNQSTSDAAR